jgi:5-methyltetrahydropteroyltriglutamate--homocysteine methyltransferase
LKLPLLPSTTIGSFSADDDVKSIGPNPQRQIVLMNTTLCEAENRGCIQLQETLVGCFCAGEYERNEWWNTLRKSRGIRLYGKSVGAVHGTRCVKPPILFGDVSRKKRYRGLLGVRNGLTSKP